MRLCSAAFQIQPLRNLLRFWRPGLACCLLLTVMAPRMARTREEGNEEAKMRALFDQKYQAWLEYCRRPEVWSHNRGDVFVNNEPFQQIIRLGIPALPYLMEKIQESPIEGRLLHFALLAITKKKFHIRQREIDGQLLWTVEEFPDVTPGRSQPDSNILWLRWWREGMDEVSQQFDQLYRRWKILQEEDQKGAQEVYRRMVDLGIAALPKMVERVGEGEADLIPAIAELTDGAVAEEAKRSQCLAWWEENGNSWIIDFPESQTPEVSADTTAAQDHEENP